MKKIIYSIEGNIGSGKSTLLSLIAKKSENVCIIKEPVDEWQKVGQFNLLQKYYQNPERWAFAFQTNAVLSRMTQLSNIIQQMQQDKFYISQRSVMADKFIFAKLLRKMNKMNQMEHQLYQNMFQAIDKLFKVPKIHKYIYLRTSPEKCFQRMIKRGRNQQSGIKLSYLKEIHSLHQQWLNRENSIVINGQKQFQGDQRQINKILQNIDHYFKKQAQNYCI